MRQVKGPSIFLSQFISNEEPFNTLEGLAKWAAEDGYCAVQIPTHLPGIFDLEKAASSIEYCEDVKKSLQKYGLEISELSTHLQGQLVAIHPAYTFLYSDFAPKNIRGDKEKMQQWGRKQLYLAADASKNLGIRRHVTFSGSLAWPYFYPWPQRPPGLIETAFQELGSIWLLILNYFDEADVDVCYELHPGEDLFDGATFERFLKEVGSHRRCNILFDPSHAVIQQLDYLAFIDKWHDRIKAFHVKDAEFNKNADQGVYGGYLPWIDRAGRCRSLGDGQVDFRSIFSKLAQYDYDGWATLEWECCIKDPLVSAREGSQLIKDYIIKPTEKSFDDFASSNLPRAEILAILGIEN